MIKSDECMGGSTPACTECKEIAVLDYRRQEYYCPKCGLVIGRNDFSERFSLPRTTTEKDEISRCRSRLRQKQKLRYVFQQKTPQTIRLTEEIAKKLNLPKYTVERAKLLAKMAIKAGLQGRKIAGACVLAACRQDGIARTINEIREKSGIEKKMVLTGLKQLQKRLGIRTTPLPAENYLLLFANRLGFYGEGLERAIALVRKAEKKINAAPTTLAATAIYMCSDFEIEKICRVSGVSFPSVRRLASFLDSAGLSSESCL